MQHDPPDPPRDATGRGGSVGGTYRPTVERSGLRILVAEDDRQVQTYLRLALGSAGYDVEVASDGRSARERIEIGGLDVVILDLDLPLLHGIDLLAGIRPANAVFVVVFSGRSDLRVDALRAGADQFLVKPVPADVLIGAIDAVARRLQADESASRAAQDVLQQGLLEIDLSSREARVDGESLPLTRREFDLLAFLFRSPGRAWTRDQLLRGVWESREDWQSPATVTEHVRRLRLKLPARAGVRVEAIRGYGYRLVVARPGTEEG